MTSRYRRFAGLVVVASALAIAVAACGSGSPSVANLGRSSDNGARNAPTTVPKDTAAESLVQWAACIRRHGDPEQTDPTVDAHGVINIDIPGNAGSLSNAVHGGTAPCNDYLAAASAELRAATPTAKPPDQAQLVKFSQCMRANGVPNYPDPGTGDETNLRGSGIDPNSPFVQRATDICGKKIGAPSWWISGAGPPGDITVESSPNCPASGCPPRRGTSGAISPPPGGSQPADG